MPLGTLRQILETRGHALGSGPYEGNVRDSRAYLGPSQALFVGTLGHNSALDWGHFGGGVGGLGHASGLGDMPWP